MADSLEDVNEKLDELLPEFFEKIEELQRARSALASNMKNGFILMSKARYSMGNKSVSSLQYSEKMEATAKVFTNDDFLTKSAEAAEEITDERFKIFQLFTEGGSMREEKCKTNELDASPENVVRRRRVLLTNGHKKDLVNSREEDEGGHVPKKTEKRFADPLKWFGVLVPSCLRQCQQEFKSSCQLLCEIAELQCEVNRIMCDFKQSKKLKESLKS